MDEYASLALELDSKPLVDFDIFNDTLSAVPLLDSYEFTLLLFQYDHMVQDQVSVCVCERVRERERESERVRGRDTMCLSRFYICDPLNESCHVPKSYVTYQRGTSPMSNPRHE